MFLGSAQSPSKNEPMALSLGEPKQETLTPIYLLRRCAASPALPVCFHSMLCNVVWGQLDFLLLVWLIEGLHSSKFVLSAFNAIRSDFNW